MRSRRRPARARARFLFTSTGGAIYGEGAGRADEMPFAESSACEPFSVYGQSKLAAEGYLASIAASRDLSTVDPAAWQRLRPAPGPAPSRPG